MSRPRVPKFGEWDGGDNSYPYTVCFEKARRDRAGEKSETLNDPLPQVTPNLPPYGESRFQPPQPRARHHQEHKTRPDDHRQSGSNHSSKSGSNHSSKSGSNHSSKSGNKQSRRTRPQKFGVDNFSSPPAAEHVQVKNSSNDTASGKGSHDKGRRNDAKANRVRHSSIGDEHGRVGVALPKFGQWDVNPASSDGGYTQVFNLVREEKRSMAKSPLRIQAQVDQQLMNSGRRKSTGSSVHTASCCFPWSRR